MTTKSVSVTNLPYWESGKRRIRYLYLVGDNSFQVTKPSTNEVNKCFFYFLNIAHATLQMLYTINSFMSSFIKEPVIPLFLGADLFLNTDVRTENHPRYHAKFAKRGLATKLAFSSGIMSLS